MISLKSGCVGHLPHGAFLRWLSVHSKVKATASVSLAEPEKPLRATEKALLPNPSVKTVERKSQEADTLDYSSGLGIWILTDLIFEGRRPCDRKEGVDGGRVAEGRLQSAIHNSVSVERRERAKELQLSR